MNNQVVKIFSVKVASTLTERLLGLIANPNQRILFQTRFGIHTILMKQPIDVLVLSDKGKVVSLRENLKPWKLFFWNPKYSQVLELPTGEIKKLNLHLGDFVHLN